MNRKYSGRVARLSLGADGQEPNADTPSGQGEKIGISYDGTWVVFSTNAKNLGGNIVMKNVRTGATRIVATELANGVGRPEISRRGAFVVFGTSGRLDQRFQSSGIFVTYTGSESRP